MATKRMLAMLLAAVMLLSLCACGSSAKTENGIKYYQLDSENNAITSDDGMVEVAFDNYCFTDYWGYLEDRALHIPYATPDEAWFQAEEGNTFLIVTGTMTLVGEIQVKTSYVLEGFDLNGFELDYENATMFSYGNWGVSEPGIEAPFGIGANGAAVFEPQADNNEKVVTVVIEVPEEVETDSQSPLSFTAELNSRPENGAPIFAEFTVQLR